jgi:hypothetical protein
MTSIEAGGIKGVTVRAGTRIGIDHITKQKNGQDSLLLNRFFVRGKEVIVGLVSDGCSGEKKTSRTEVGSALLIAYAFSEIRSMLALGVDISQIPSALYPRCVAYIGSVARLTWSGSTEEMSQFIGNYFLATLLGFITDGEKLVEFASGDGFHVVNSEGEVFDHANASLYMAYHQLARESLEGSLELPDSFEHIATHDVTTLERYAIGTDGLVRKDPERGFYLDMQEIDCMFQYKPAARAGLQWWLNKRQTEDSAFNDDVSVITLDWRIDRET